jgi:hypothetical protein
MCTTVSGLLHLVSNDLLFLQNVQKGHKILSHEELILSLKRRMEKSTSNQSLPIRLVKSP